MGRKRCVSVWNLHTPCSPLPVFSCFLTLLLCSRRYNNPKYQYLTLWELDSTINYHFGVFMNSSDKSYL